MTTLILPSPRAAHCPPAPTRRSALAASRVGYLFDKRSVLEPSAGDDAVHIPIKPGAVTLVTGPSGAGKTTLLCAARAAAETLGHTVADPDRVTLHDRPAVDLLMRATRADVGSALSSLSDAGLAEAGCIIRRPRELSAGQRARLRLALALSALGEAPRADRAPAPLLIADEFAAILDSATARSVGVSLRRTLGRLGVAALIATPRDDLLVALRPDRMLHVGARSRATITRPDPRDLAAVDAYDIAPGAMADYRALAHHHYRAGSPTRPTRILVARDVRSGERAGVLVVCFPTLNGVWRRYAWPGVFSLRDRRAAAHRLNANVRRIARVVVEPRCRGAGLAQRLVAHALATAQTPCTEAVAAMGRFSSFFERAGMTRYDLPLRPRDARLLDALDSAGVEPWRLATAQAAWARAGAAVGAAFLEREVQRWARARGDPERLFFDACRRLGCRMTAFAHGAPDD